MSDTPRPFPVSTCNAMRRGATPHNTVQPTLAFDKTNPIFEPDDSPLAPALGVVKLVASTAAQKLAPEIVAACNVVQRDATQRNAVQRISTPRKTNPIAGDELDPRQLAAARLLATGRSVAQAAAELKLNRTTVWRWQRHPAFRAELRRIHERMVVASGRCGV